MSEIPAKELAAKYKRHKPISGQKHDGKLDSRVDDDFYAEAWLDGRYVRIESWSHQIVLEAKQALSLLVWLRQEEGTLEQLAQEQ